MIKWQIAQLLKRVYFLIIDDIYNLPEFSQKSKVKEIYTMDIAHRFD